jgi:hypothetical protein
MKSTAYRTTGANQALIANAARAAAKAPIRPLAGRYAGRTIATTNQAPRPTNATTIEMTRISV